MNYDIEFISILYSQSIRTGEWLFETIEYLKSEDVLSSEELKLCEDCVGNLEINGRTYIENIITDDIEIHKYDYSEIDSKIEEFVATRKCIELKDMLDNLTLENMYSKENMTKYFKGYTDRIHSSIDTTILDELDDLEIFYDRKEEIDISTACEEVDGYCFGLPRGSITTIIGNEGSFKSMWAVNAAYQAIYDGKNVMYLTAGVDKATVIKRFLSRHSNQAEKFERPLSINGFNNKENFNLRERIILDFQENYKGKIIYFDKSDLTIPSGKSLKRLIAEAHSHFLKTTDSGLDLIVVDDMTNLSFYNGKQTLTSRGSVIEGYYKVLKELSRNLFGTGFSCSVLCTHKDKDNGTFATKNNGNYTLNVINEQIVFWSDCILTIYDPSSLREIKEQARVKVLKTLSGDVMDREITIKVDYTKWFLSSNNMSFIDMKHLLNLQQVKIKNLESTVEVVTEQKNNAEALLEKSSKNDDISDCEGFGISGLIE